MDLHLRHAQRLELLQHGRVVRDEGGDGGGPVQVAGALGGLGQADQGVGAVQDGHGRLLADRLLAALDPVEEHAPVRGGARDGGARQLGHHVVVVGVEQLGHVLRLRALHAAGHGKVLGQAGQRVEALGREAQVERPVQDLVVQRAVQADQLDAGVLLDLPGGGLGLVPDLEEVGLGELALPEPMQRWRGKRRKGRRVRRGASSGARRALRGPNPLPGGGSHPPRPTPLHAV